jgi:hypothetical protein
MFSFFNSSNRREWIGKAAGVALAAGSTCLGRMQSNAAEPQKQPQTKNSASLPPIRQITRGPKYHWFGYYDKLEFDPTGRYVLGMEVDFQGRAPRPDDVIRVGMVDLERGDRWIELGASRAWCWQQGCMLQWRPGSKSEAIWNDREGDRFVCHILDVFSGKRRTIPHPIYTIATDGRWAVSTNFARLNHCRPGYGYAGLPDKNRDVSAPADSGIFRVELDTGEAKMLVSLADVVKIPHGKNDLTKAIHWFNHLLINPDGTRFEFLHRWRAEGRKDDFITRMCTAAPDGTDIRMIDPSGATSHFIWRDPTHILAWSWHASHKLGFYLFEDRSGGPVELVGGGVMTANGHCSYLPGNRWILNDSYPQGKERVQSPYLFEVPTGRRVWLGHFPLPSSYNGQWRCDTHPRFSPDGRRVVIDSAHTGQGRQLFLIDIGEIVRTA